MGYDRFPEALIDEKTALLERLLARRGRISRDGKGRFGLSESSGDVTALAE